MERTANGLKIDEFSYIEMGYMGHISVPLPAVVDPLDYFVVVHCDGEEPSYGNIFPKLGEEDLKHLESVLRKWERGRIERQQQRRSVAKKH